MKKQLPLVLTISLFLTACAGHFSSNATIPKAVSTARSAVGVAPEAKPVASNPTIIYPKDVKRPQLSERDLMLISRKIYFNEASLKPKNLIIWNDNEKFVSLGIGHFIWYPEGANKRFDETFPSLIDYLRKNQVRIPFWLQSARKRGAPWKTKGAFLASQNDPEVRELRRILMSTKELQTLFFFDRIHRSIPKILAQVPHHSREKVKNNYNALANTKGGWYPLIDYVNFKGTGLKATERYQGVGWGMLQVLQEMRPVQPGPVALNEFSRAALSTLKRRINNSPDENNEYRWLAGWTNRVNTYRKPLDVN